MNWNEKIKQSRELERKLKMNGRTAHVPIMSRLLSMFVVITLVMATSVIIFLLNGDKGFCIGKLNKGRNKPETTTAEDYQVKMVFIEKLTRFVDWPESSAVKDVSKPFVIGFLGQLRHKRESVEILSEGVKEIKGKSLEIRMISEKEDILKCDMLIISHSEKSKLSSIIAAVKNKPILTVSDADGFAQQGVHINIMSRRSGAWDFVINEGALIDSQLDVRHQLKAYAKKIINKRRRRRRR